MYAYEFKAEIDDGKIMIPEKYKKKLGKRVKVIVLTDDDRNEKTKAKFNSIQLNTKGYNFDREEANER